MNPPRILFQIQGYMVDEWGISKSKTDFNSLKLCDLSKLDQFLSMEPEVYKD